MPLVSIVPTTKLVEEVLADRIGELRGRIKDTICNISGFPRNDVIVNLLHCPYRNADPDSTNLILYADTCPHEELEIKANELCAMTGMVLADMGFTHGQGAEVWPRFLPGPWCLVKGREIVDRVGHPRDKPWSSMMT